MRVSFAASFRAIEFWVRHVLSEDNVEDIPELRKQDAEPSKKTPYIWENKLCYIEAKGRMKRVWQIPQYSVQLRYRLGV